MSTLRLTTASPWSTDAPRWRRLALLIGVLGSLAVVATYGVFSQTWDEPAHIAAGMQWLSTGAYTYEAEHPPLARVATALGPYLAGERSHGLPAMYDEGRAIIGMGAHYRRTLALARLGELPFLWLMLWVVWAWARRLAGEAAGAVAVLLTVTNPSVLAHAGLATTDLAPAAFAGAALFAYVAWLDRPGWREGLLLGLALGLGATTKFSAIGFMGGAIVLTHVMRGVTTRHWRAERAEDGPPVAASTAATLLTAMTAVWGVYRFHVGAVPGTHLVLPAPEFFRGLYDFAHHGATGHPAFLLGEVRMTGWWYYFPVALAVKTPLPLLLLGAIGAGLSLRDWRDWRWLAPVALIGVVLALAAVSKVDLGVRLVLAVYPPLAVLGARAALLLAEQARASSLTRLVAPGMLAYAAIVPVASFPDYLAYFNPLAGRHPERILVDSNLDWGQDLYRLAQAERAWHMDSLHVHYFGSSSLMAAGVVNARRLAPDERATGWIAASETFLAGVWSDTSLAWLNRLTPVERVGRSMRLYFIPPPHDSGGAPGSSAPAPSIAPGGVPDSARVQIQRRTRAQ